MLQVINLSKHYGAETVLEGVSFVVNPGERVGLIGPNGSGKSTLLRIVAGVEGPDGGRVALGAGDSVDHLSQGIDADSGRTVGEAIRTGLAEYEGAKRTVHEIEGRMAHASGAELDRLLEGYGRATERFEALGGYDVEHRTSAVIDGLGLGSIEDDAPLSQLSGGQQTRAGLASLLVADPSVLLLDEPTNHLDIDALEWLEGFLTGYTGAALIVSHDRAFLDRTVSGILELDDVTHRITAYPGNYSEYRFAKERDRDKQMAAWKDQQAETRRIEQDIRRTKETALRTETSTNHDFYRRRAKKVAQKAKARERRLERTLASPDQVEKPRAQWAMKLEFGQMPRGGQRVLSLDGAGHRYGDDWLFRDARLSLEHGERIALLGPNGSGKSTLLRIVAGETKPSEGEVRVGANVKIGYMPQEQEGLDRQRSAVDIVREATDMTETEARTFLHLYLFEGDEPLLPVGTLSYGQRSRLLLAKLVLEGANFLLLDEPVNHLDISSREQFEAALDAFPGTVLMAVHDRALIDRYATGVWSVEGGSIRRYLDREEMRKTVGA